MPHDVASTHGNQRLGHESRVRSWMSAQDSEKRLRQASLRVTVPRTSVLQLLEQHPHSDVRSLKSLVAGHIGPVSTQTRYDVVAALVRAGLVRRIGSSGTASLFELRIADNHHHVVCRSCGALDDVDCVRGEAPCLTPPVTKGFNVDEAEVTFWGTCTACADTIVDGAQTPASTEESI